ncbi:hypothetical protein IMCC26134_15065 [Verrucomicrobia bacterium IMCC26134]|nr:hypothetical protein IMCC26134_15065 [Verrucomicrobia bacterium IMCC26134]
MANLTLTSASVLQSSSAITLNGIAGVALGAGQPVYRDTADLDSAGNAKWKLYDADAVTPVAILNGCQGIAANSAAAGQPCTVVLSDPAFTHGLAAVTKGDIIIASATAGALAPAADLASTMRPCVVMFAISSTQATVDIAQSLTAK